MRLMYKKYKSELFRYLYIAALMVSGIVFFFLIGQKGPIVSDDSVGFLSSSQGITVIYVLYPRFLQFFRIVFGEQSFLNAVCIFQGLLALFVSVISTEFFRKEYKLNYIMAFVVYVLTFLPYAYSLPESVATHHILTEGIAFPLFMIYMVTIIKLLLYKKKRYVCEGLVFSIILVLLRTQLLVLLFVFLILCIIFILKTLYDRLPIEKKKKFIIINAIIGIITFAMGISLFYKVLLTGQLSQFSDAITGKVLCLMDYEDRELFEGEIREVFDVLYQNASDKGNLIDLKEYQRADKISHNINENTKDWSVVISDYYNEKYRDVAEKDKMYKYRMRDIIMHQLLEAHIVDYLILTIKLMPHSFVASIFIQPDIFYESCHMITGVIYLFSIGFTVYAHKKGCDSRYLKPLMITLFVILFNVVITNVFFYGQQRYVVYPFGIFYISVFIEVIGICRKLQKQKPASM